MCRVLFFMSTEKNASFVLLSQIKRGEETMAARLEKATTKQRREKERHRLYSTADEAFSRQQKREKHTERKK